MICWDEKGYFPNVGYKRTLLSSITCTKSHFGRNIVTNYTISLVENYKLFITYIIGIKKNSLYDDSIESVSKRSV